MMSGGDFSIAGLLSRAYSIVVPSASAQEATSAPTSQEQDKIINEAKGMISYCSEGSSLFSWRWCQDSTYSAAVTKLTLKDVGERIARTGRCDEIDKALQSASENFFFSSKIIIGEGVRIELKKICDSSNLWYSDYSACSNALKTANAELAQCKAAASTEPAKSAPATRRTTRRAATSAKPAPKPEPKPEPEKPKKGKVTELPEGDF